MVVVKAWIILARSAVDGSAIGKEVEAVDEAGLECGAEVEEERRLADTKLSRASVLKVAGP